jgi:hypothetical protein
MLRQRFHSLGTGYQCFGYSLVSFFLLLRRFLDRSHLLGQLFLLSAELIDII